MRELNHPKTAHTARLSPFHSGVYPRSKYSKPYDDSTNTYALLFQYGNDVSTTLKFFLFSEPHESPVDDEMALQPTSHVADCIPGFYFSARDAQLLFISRTWDEVSGLYSEGAMGRTGLDKSHRKWMRAFNAMDGHGIWLRGYHPVCNRQLITYLADCFFACVVS